MYNLLSLTYVTLTHNWRIKKTLLGEKVRWREGILDKIYFTWRSFFSRSPKSTASTRIVKCVERGG